MNQRSVAMWLLNNAPLLLFALVLIVFGSLSGKFLELQNLANILIQSSATAVAAIGMTVVLLTAGVDLSIGSVMFLVVAITGKLILGEWPISYAFAIGFGVGLLCGAVNALLVTRMRIIAFIATLGMLFVVRGTGLWLTNTRAMNMPDAVTQLGASKFLAIPLPVLVMLATALVVHFGLRCTPWGRQIYAVGCDLKSAQKAGLRVGALLFSAYVLCGACAAVSGLIALTQTGAVSPSFGQQKEFSAIAAAVLGGTSLFGGRGNVLPGTVMGAILFQTVENGLVIINADPYLYPLILSSIIFIAVWLDTGRANFLTHLARRKIRQTHA